MFWNREDISVPSPTAQARLRAELRDRLRLAAEFATLGAYEFTEPAAEAHGDTPHARDGAPTRGVVMGRLDDDTRFVATLPSDRTTLEAMEATEGVGRRGLIRGDGAENVFDPA